MAALAAGSGETRLLCLPGGSDRLGSLPNTTLPGAILLLVDASFVGLKLAYEAHLQWPWAPVVVESTDPKAYNGLPGGLKIPGSVASPTGLRDAQALRQLIRLRPEPQPIDLGNYILRRCPDIPGQALIRQVSEVSSSRTLRAQSRSVSHLSHRQWIDMVLTIMLMARSMNTGRNQLEIAVEAGHGPNYLSRKCRKVFGMRWRDVLRLSAWEAHAEVAIRHAGFCQGKRGMLP